MRVGRPFRATVRSMEMERPPRGLGMGRPGGAGPAKGRGDHKVQGSPVSRESGSGVTRSVSCLPRSGLPAA